MKKSLSDLTIGWMEELQARIKDLRDGVLDLSELRDWIGSNSYRLTDVIGRVLAYVKEIDQTGHAQ